MTEQNLREQQLLKQQDTAAQFAVLALRSLMLVSGGSVIAILTFLGSLWTKDDALARATAQRLESALIVLVVAVVGSVFSACLGYLSALAQVYRITKPTSCFGRAAVWIRAAGITLALLTAFAFAIGAIMAALGLAGAGGH